MTRKEKEQKDIEKSIDRARNAFAHFIAVEYGSGKFKMPDKQRLIIMENMFIFGFLTGEKSGYNRGRRKP